MPSAPVYLVFILGIFTITAQKKPSTEVEKILNYLTKNFPSNKGKTNGRRTTDHHPGEGHEDIPNLTNIQTLNLYFKHNNVRDKKKSERDLVNYLKRCKATGRCGCSGGRCGGPRTDEKTIDDVEQLLNYLDEDLNREQDEKYDDVDENNIDLALKRSRNKYDDLDVIFLEVPDSEGNHLISKLQNLGDDVKVVDLRNVDIKKLLNSRNEFDEFTDNVQRTHDVLTPEDFALYYDEAKTKITDSLFEYVRGQKESPYLSQLTPRQVEEINRLKDNQSPTRLSESETKSFIVNIIFGYLNTIKILPQRRDSNIYVPQVVYDAVKRFIKSLHLRIKKRSVLPLTAQQKERKQNKAATKIIPKHAWRRNFPEQPKYGVPFNLNVQGLGQLNN